MSAKATKLHLNTLPRRGFRDGRGTLAGIRCDNYHGALEVIGEDACQVWPSPRPLPAVVV